MLENGERNIAHLCDYKGIRNHIDNQFVNALENFFVTLAVFRFLSAAVPSDIVRVCMVVRTKEREQ